MEDDFRYRVNYSENIAPKYPHASEEGLEVVPNESPLYSLPPAPLPAVGDEKWASNAREWGWPVHTPATAVTAPEGSRKEERRRILGLTVPIFWTVVVIIVLVLAAAIGGGIGGGLKAQQTSNSNTSRFVFPYELKTSAFDLLTCLKVMQRIRHSRQRRHHQHQEGLRRLHPHKMEEHPQP